MNDDRTPDQIRAEAAHLREIAQYAEGRQYFDELRRARELEQQAAHADRQAAERRRKELAQIHIAIKDLGLDRDTYEAMLDSVAGVRSASDLDAEGRRRVIEHLRGLGWQPRRPGRGRPAAGRAELVRKIRAQLAEAGRPDTYADGIARKMFGVERFEWCGPDQLRRIVAALDYNARRHGRRRR